MKSSQILRPAFEQLEDRRLLSASAMSTLGGSTASFSLLNGGIVWETSGPNVGVVSGGVQGLYQGADSAGNLVAFELVNHFLDEYTPNQGWLGIGGADQVAQDVNNHLFLREGGNLFEATGVPSATATGSQFLSKGVQQLDQGRDFAGNPMVYVLEKARLYQVTQAPGLNTKLQLKGVGRGRTAKSGAHVLVGLGIGYDNVADALKIVYGTSTAAAGGILQGAGADADAIATALALGYKATPKTVAGVLHGLHFSLNDIVAAIDGITGGNIGTDANALYTGIRGTSLAAVAGAIYTGVGSVSFADLAGGLKAGIPGTTPATVAAALKQGVSSATPTDLATALDVAFAEPAQGTAGILKGLGYQAPDLAAALHTAYGSNDQQCANILKNLGFRDATIASALQQVFGETAQAAALALENLGASATDVAKVLSSVFGESDQASAGLLSGMGNSPAGLAGVLHSVFGDNDQAVAGILNGLGSSPTTIATALSTVFGDTDKVVAGILNGLGVSPTDIGTALSGTFGDSDKVTAAILNGLGTTSHSSAAVFRLDSSANGMTPTGIATVLQSVYGDSNKTAAGILQGLGYSYTDIATALAAAYGNNDQTIASILNGLGAGWSDIATALKNAIGESDQATALLLVGQGAMPGDIAPILQSVYGDSDQQVAGIMYTLGCSPSYIAQTLMKVYGDSDQAVATALHGAGASATDIATALKNIFADSDAATANIIHSLGVQTADILTGLVNVFGGVWSGATELVFGSQGTLFLIDGTGSFDSDQDGVLTVIFGGTTTTTSGSLTFTTTKTVTSMGVGPNGFLYFDGTATTGSVVVSGVESLAPGSSQPQPVIVSVNEGPFGTVNEQLNGQFVIDSLGRMVIGGLFGTTDRYTINADGSLILYQSFTIPGDYVVMPDASIIYTAVDTGTAFEIGPNSITAVPATEVTAIIFSSPTRLVVTGTAGNDTITVRQQHGQISVDGAPIFSNGQFVSSIPASAVTLVQIHGAGGDDTIRYVRSPGESTTPSVSLYGDGGTGTLGGGDVLDSGTGNDYTGIMVPENEVLDLSTGDLSINGVSLPTAVYNAVTAPYGVAAMYPLGTPLSSMTISGGSLYTFQNGVVFDTSAGIFLVTGPIFTEYQALGGEAVVGTPVNNMDGSVLGGSQTFSNGVLSLVGGSVSSVVGPIFQKYLTISAQLGAATGNAQTLPGGLEVQNFSSGCIFAQGGQTGDVYLSTAGTVLYLDASSGNDQFEVYQTPVVASLGLFTTHVKWMGTAVFTTGGGENVTSIQANLMGADTLNVHDTSLPYTVGYAGFELPGPVWVEFSGMQQQLGNPTDNATQGNGTTHQEFQNGAIYYAAVPGAHAILGNPNDPTTFLGKFVQLDSNQSLGLPTADAVQAGGTVVYQQFQSGYLYYDGYIGLDAILALGSVNHGGVVAPDGSTWFLGTSVVQDSAGAYYIYSVSNGQVTRLPGGAGVQLENNNGMYVVQADGSIAQWTGTTFQPYQPPAPPPPDFSMASAPPLLPIEAGQLAIQVNAGDPSTYPFEYAFGKAIGPYDAIKLGIVTYYSAGTLDVAYLITNYFEPLALSEGKAILLSIGSKLSINDLGSFVAGLVSDLISGDGSGTFDGFRFQVGFKVQKQGVLTNVFVGARDDLEHGIGAYAAGELEGVLATNGLGDVVDFVNQLGNDVGVKDLTKTLLSGQVLGPLGQAAGNDLNTIFSGSGAPFGLSDIGPKSNIFIPYIAWQKV